MFACANERHAKRVGGQAAVFGWGFERFGSKGSPVCEVHAVNAVLKIIKCKSSSEVSPLAWWKYSMMNATKMAAEACQMTVLD